jgi:hypothetical protein
MKTDARTSARKPASALLGLVFALVLVEAAFRLTHGRLYDEFDAIGTVTTVEKYAFHGKYDSEVGWIPESQAPGDELFPYGIRPNGPGRVWQVETARRPLVLAVGDSFTWGDDVPPGDSMPARLEQECGWAVLNAGVGGYGLDQIVLRAEQLAPKLKPDVVLVSYIEDDLRRALFRFRSGTPKPYFEVENGGVVLRNYPVPPWKHRPNEIRRPQEAWWRHSYAVTWLLIRLFPDRILEGTTASMAAPATAELRPIVTEIFRRLDRLAAELDVPVFVVRLHGNDRSPEINSVSPFEADESAFRAGFGVERLRYVDLVGEFQSIQERDPAKFRTFQAAAEPFSGHNSALGNAYVAKRIADHVCHDTASPNER